METLIIVIGIMAVLHFIYDGIILPSIRLHLRNKLFVLRDQIRNIKINTDVDKSDESVYWFVHDGINGFLTRLPQLSLIRTIELKQEYDKNEKLRESVEARIEKLENCTNSEITDIFHQTNKILAVAMIANMGGWFFYLLPIALLLATVKSIFILASELVVTPRETSNSMFNNHGYT